MRPQRRLSRSDDLEYLVFPLLHYITCNLADSFILSRRHFPLGLAQGPNSCTDLIMATSGIKPPTLRVQVKYLNHYATGCPSKHIFLIFKEQVRDAPVSSVSVWLGQRRAPEVEDEIPQKGGEGLWLAGQAVSLEPGPKHEEHLDQRLHPELHGPVLLPLHHGAIQHAA